MTETTVLLTAPYMILYAERFQPVFDEFGLKVIIPEVNERMEAKHILAYAGLFDGTICGDDRYTAEVIKACLPRLKVISKWGTGIDSIDKKTANELGVMVGNTLDAFTTPVSDSVMGYILGFARRHAWMDKAMKAGEWEKIPGHALSEATLGVVGMGRIGQAVTRKARAFGMRVLGTDIQEVSPEFIAQTGVEMTSLKGVLQKADYVSMNTDLNPSSSHLINEETLSWMKPNAVIINTSRGPVIHEEALVKALLGGKIGGAALDVFEFEPLPADSPLLIMDNVMLAPHNSNSSPAAWERVHWRTIRNLLIGLGLPFEELDPGKYA
ncbi:MAG: phosphoglycerate dehydrogenase [Anaerolineales bacterium]|nr:phosphoglycerate dehydrogenase [Anaerolineales bacterium]